MSVLIELGDEWSRAARGLATALRVLAGRSDEVRAWADFGSSIRAPASLTLAQSRLPINLLHFRANYARMVGVVLVICVIRHPISALCVLLVGSASFHALLVRHGVVRVELPARVTAAASLPTPVILAGPQLYVPLVVVSLFALAFCGCLWFALWFALLPAGLVLAHAALRVPPTRLELSACNSVEGAGELLVEMRLALRGERERDDDEVEGAASELEPPARTDELARRVEQIKQKYGPPTTSHSKKVN